MIGTFVRVEGEEIVSPKLGHAEPSATTEPEDASLAVVWSIHVARVDERSDLVYLEKEGHGTGVVKTTEDRLRGKFELLSVLQKSATAIFAHYLDPQSFICLIK